MSLCVAMDEPPAAGLLAMSMMVRLAPWFAAMRGAAMVDRLSAGTAIFCSRRDMSMREWTEKGRLVCSERKERKGKGEKKTNTKLRREIQTTGNMTHTRSSVPTR